MANTNESLAAARRARPHDQLRRHPARRLAQYPLHALPELTAARAVPGPRLPDRAQVPADSRPAPSVEEFDDLLTGARDHR